MPNMKDMQVAHNFFLVGHGGSGKTSQFLTLPGKKFAFLFEPAAFATLKDFDIDYEYFPLSRVESLYTAAHKALRTVEDEDALPLRRFDSVLQDYMGEGTLDKYDSILLDSTTSMYEASKQSVLAMSKRAGSVPDMGDYNVAQINILSTVMWLAGLGKYVMITAHPQSPAEKRREYCYIGLGPTRSTPGAGQFTNVLLMERKDNGRYVACGSRDNDHWPGLGFRTSFPALREELDVTIADWKNPENYGLGKLIKESGK